MAEEQSCAAEGRRGWWKSAQPFSLPLSLAFPLSPTLPLPLSGAQHAEVPTRCIGMDGGVVAPERKFFIDNLLVRVHCMKSSPLGAEEGE